MMMLLVFSYIRSLKSNVSNRTMHNTIQYDIKVNMAIKTALIGIVKEHACSEIALIRGGCYSTWYEIVTAGSKVVWFG